jgi:hypothetical protein
VPRGYRCRRLRRLTPPVNRQEWALTFGPWLWLATRSILLAAVLRNAVTSGLAVRGGWWVAACGLALNSLVITLNSGYMPQSAEAASAVWGAAQFEPGRLYNVAPIGPSTQLAWLGDVFAEPRWLPRANVISPGDMLLALGVAVWVFGATAGQNPLKRRIVASSQLGAPTHGPARPSRRCST